MRIEKVYVVGWYKRSAFEPAENYLPFAQESEARMWVDNRSADINGWSPVAEVRYIIRDEPMKEYIT